MCSLDSGMRCCNIMWGFNTPMQLYYIILYYIILYYIILYYIILYYIILYYIILYYIILYYIILQSEKFLKSVLQRQVVSIFQPNLKHLTCKNYSFYSSIFRLCYTQYFSKYHAIFISNTRKNHAVFHTNNQITRSLVISCYRNLTFMLFHVIRNKIG